MILVHTRVCHKIYSVNQLKKERNGGEKNDFYRLFRFTQEISEAEPHHTDLLDSVTICHCVLVQTSPPCCKTRN